MKNILFRISVLRLLPLTILILFSDSSASDEIDSLLFHLAVNGPLIELDRCIVKSSSLNVRRPDGLTPLLAAVQANNRATVTVLLEHGADASIADTMNFDPLYWALHKGFYQVADVLLAHGVDVDRPNSQGNSPLMSAVMRGDLASRNHDTAMATLLSTFTPAEPGGPAADTSASNGGCSFTDAKAFFAAIQSGRRSFRSCSLMGMDCKGMRLYGLNFQGANLSGCDLRSTDMRYCDLSNAALRNAYLHGADLRYAQMDNTDFSGAMLTAADMRDAKGLSFDQLRSARNLYKTKLDDETIEVMQREYPNHFKDPGGAWNVQAKANPESR
jgi:ankyrin repeat protein